MRRSAVLFLTLAAHAAGCGTSPSATGSDQGMPGLDASLGGGPVDLGLPFQADPPAVYVAKVKYLLVGLAPTDAEVKAVTADPHALSGLVDGWMKRPEYDQKMLTFFQLAFQQTQITSQDFIDMIPNNGLGRGQAAQMQQLLQNIKESFARTAIAQVDAGKPLTQLFSTKQLMMTPALMELYAFLDAHVTDDASVVHDQFPAMTGNAPVSFETAAGPIPLADSLTPGNANYMKFYDAGVAAFPWSDPSCKMDPITYSKNVSSYVLHDWLYGSIVVGGFTSTTGVKCKFTVGKAMSSPLQASDFTTWKLVTIRKPNANEPITKFWDIGALRGASELVLATPRQGFFSTPAFFANWPTNTSNQARVTLNQSLIVATGQAIDGTDATTPQSTPGLESDHAAPGSACFFCHQLLDPSRSILAANYSWAYSPQTDPAYKNQPGQFAFEGVIQPVATLDDFTRVLETHPLVPGGWVQKLCYYVNSSPCDPGDPEFQRLVADFQASHFDWNALVKDLVTSPITTNTVATQTSASRGEVVAVTRRDHLCQALDARLGLTDVCGLDLTAAQQQQHAVTEIVGGLPSDGYGRGAMAPVLPNEPTLFFRAGLENICIGVAAQVIDGGVKKWTSTQPDAAIADFVATMLGFTASDPRAAAATTLLKSHFTQAMKSGAAASAALQSTFVVACLSPSFVGIGM